MFEEQSVVYSSEPTGPIQTYGVGQALQLNPELFPLIPVWRFLRVSYKGGLCYKGKPDAAGEPIFVEHERESFSNPSSRVGVARRKRLSVYKNYCKQIINGFNDAVFQNRIKRDESDPTFAEWLTNCDGLRTPLTRFMQRAVRDAQIVGRSYVQFGIANGIQEGEDPLTVAQARARGMRPVLSLVTAESMIDFRRGFGGALTECLIEYNDGTAVHWTPTEWTQYKHRGRTVTEVEGPSPHSFGRLPIIELCPFDGDSQIEDIAELNKQVYNLDSLLRSELYHSHFTQHVIFGVNAKQLENTELGISQILCHPDKDGSVGRLSPEISAADSIRASIDSDIREIFRLAGLRSGDPTATGAPQSGVAKAWDFREMGSRLTSIATAAEGAEGAIVEIWGRIMSGPTPGRSEYSLQFDMPDADREISRLLDLLSSEVIPAKMKQIVLARSLPVLCPGISQPEISQIVEEAEELAAAISSPEAALKRQREFMNTGTGANVE